MKTLSILTTSGIAALLLFSMTQSKVVQLSEFPARAKATKKTELWHAPVRNSEVPLELLVIHQPLSPEMQQTQAHGSLIAGHNDPANLRLEDIVYLEAEEPLELGFDVDAYLPADFDPYASAGPDLDAIRFLEEEEEVVLGFDPLEYLPIGFNPYAGMDLSLEDIVYIEEEAPVALGFDVNDYLPEGFNPFAKPEPDLDTIDYIEDEVPVVLDFDVNAYLPADFDPYAAPELDLDEIIFLEAEEEIELWKEVDNGETDEPHSQLLF